MGTITATVDQQNSRVKIDIDWTSQANSAYCWVWRGSAGVYTLLREGNLCTLSGGKATIYDFEPPLDTPVTYRTTAPLNTNGNFAFNAYQWNSPASAATFGCAITSTTDFFLPGFGNTSGMVTFDGTTASPVAASEKFAVAAGVTVSGTASMMLDSPYIGTTGASPAGFGFGFDWYNSSGVYLSTSVTATNAWPSYGLWDAYSWSYTAPANTAFAAIIMLSSGPRPPTTTHAYMAEVHAMRADGSSTVETAPVILPSGGVGYWKDVLHPATMVRLICDPSQVPAQQGVSGIYLAGLSAPTYPADSSVQEIPGASRGGATWGTRKSGRRTIVVASTTSGDEESLRALHATGAPLLLQLPKAWNVADFYALYDDAPLSLLGQDMTVGFRSLAIDLVHIDAPVGLPAGQPGTRWRDMLRAGAPITFAQANTSGFTWKDALSGNVK